MKKNTFSLIGIIALVAVIGLGMTGCDNGTTDNGGGNNNGGGGTYTVSFNEGSGGGTPPASQTVNAESSITLPNQENMTAPSGQNFNGWSTGGQNYAAGYSYTVNANTTFTAQ
jgi:hypothetical protein